MNPNRIKYCPCTLQTGYATYSPNGQQLLFGNRSKKVSHIIPFSEAGKTIQIPRALNEKRIRISISGVQEKFSVTEHRNRLTVSDTHGTHILKPVPADRFDLVNDLPVNEHVTMQIARQVFGIKTAACGTIFLADGTPAYITRRFDYKPDGISKYQVEDFSSLLAKSPERNGDNHKYNASYLDIAKAIHRYVAAAPIALMEFFRLVVFN
ncbi:MAG: HipA domain-containing protein, partial [Chitinophagaceae bacterium]|nr:HipA domain-containing protein [Chitinophagaceae bacterium]